MHEYDAVLKLLLQGPARQTLLRLTHSPITEWLNIELPEVVRNTRADLLGRTADGQIVHLELQSNNDSDMALRMAEYCLRIYRSTGKLPRQILLYVGRPKVRMQARLQGPGLNFEYQIVDIRSFESETLLESPDIGDNVIAVLGHLKNKRRAVREVLERIAAAEPAAREPLLRQLLVLAGLRELEEMVEGEVKKMPILESILDNRVLGREFKRGLQEGLKEGRQEGHQEGLQEGRQDGELIVLRRQLEKRFGPLPTWAERKLTSCPEPELVDIGIRLLEAQSLDELLR